LDERFTTNGIGAANVATGQRLWTRANSILLHDGDGRHCFAFEGEQTGLVTQKLVKINIADGKDAWRITLPPTQLGGFNYDTIVPCRSGWFFKVAWRNDD